MANYWDRFIKDRVKRRRVLQMAALGSAGIGALALVGCGSDDEDEAATTGSGTTGGTTGSTGAVSSGSGGGELATEQVVRRRITQDLIGMDPATIFRINTEEIAFHVYSALATYGPSAEPVPDLAESWEVGPDQTTLTFKLHAGVQWHKGYGELTSEDVKFSYDRILDPATGSTYINQFNLIDSIESPDATTVTIKLKEPDANFFHQVANYHQGAIANQRALEELGADYGYNPIGTGPFTFESFVPDQEVVIQRFDEYFGGPATLERIHLRFISDQETGAIAFQNGEVDIMGSTSNEETFKRLEADDRVAVNWQDQAGGPSVGLFSGKVPVLQDPRVRKAYSHAIDNEAVSKATSPLTYRVWNSIIPDWMDGYTDDLPTYGYEPETARQLLEAAGHGDGLTLKLLTSGVSAANQFEQDYLSRVGITLEFEVVDQPAFVSRRPNGDFEVAGRFYPAVNPDEMLFGHFHTDYAPPNGLNTTFYSNPEVDSLLEAARADFDRESRLAKYVQAQQLAMADAPYRTSNFNRRVEFAFKWIEGVQTNPLTNMLYYPMKVLKQG
jgi:ABC-type transport system substrate-binding protein